MVSWQLLCLVTLGILAINSVVMWLLTRKDKRQPTECPNCGSSAVGMTNREPSGLHYSDIHGGSGGGYATTQVKYTCTMRCNRCRHSWTITQTDSN